MFTYRARELADRVGWAVMTGGNSVGTVLDAWLSVSEPESCS